MPLNPARVGSPGRAPLLRYLDAIEENIKKRGIVYNLIVMPSEKDDAEVMKALTGFVRRRVKLFVVDRAELPAHLRDNFSLYEHSKTVCVPLRGDDATILGGTI